LGLGWAIDTCRDAGLAWRAADSHAAVVASRAVRRVALFSRLDHAVAAHDELALVVTSARVRVALGLAGGADCAVVRWVAGASAVTLLVGRLEDDPVPAV